MGLTIHPPAGALKESNVWVRITRQTVALRRVVRVGEEINVTATDARLLISGRKAERIDPPVPAQAPAATSPEVTEAPAQAAQPSSRRSRRKGSQP